MDYVVEAGEAEVFETEASAPLDRTEPLLYK